MAYPFWPAELPQYPSVSGTSRGFADGRLFQAMAQGPAKIRLRTSAAIKPLSVSFMMTVAEVSVFEAFWDDDTKGGSLPFYFPNYDDEGEFWLVVFGENAPVVTPTEYDAEQVSFTLSILP